MRRKDRQITDRAYIEKILEEEMVCRIALCEGDRPYIVPMNFGYKDGYLYLHSAREGRKIDILKKNKNLCFQIDRDCEVTGAGAPCNWSMRYCSVVGFGKAMFVENIKEKIEALNVIVEQHIGKPQGDYPKETLNRLAVIKVKIEELTGKMSEG